MDPAFWHQKWHNNEIGFHEGAPNDLMVRHFPSLGVRRGGRVFVPLCGKSHDMIWLHAQGYEVVGAELSRIAVEQFFEERGVTPTITTSGPLDCFAASGIAIFVGDIFSLDGASLGPVDAIHDRAALVALPGDLRPRYTQHLREITGDAPVFQVTFAYDQSRHPGPPFSVDAAEIRAHYAASHQITLAESRAVPGGLRGQCPAEECAWLLQRLG